MKKDECIHESSNREIGYYQEEMMRYGFFDDKNREYVITNPKTPTKWINYIGTLAFGGFVDQTGGALLCKGDPALNRITKYIAQMPASDFHGTTLYIRLKTREGYRIFSPFFTPCLVPYEKYECRIGLGYTRIISQIWGARIDVTIFVPQGQNREIRDIRVTNVGETYQEFDAIPVVEYTHFDALKQLTNADWVPQTMQSEVVALKGGLKVLKQYAFMRKHTHINYLTSNLPVSSFETDRKVFLGDNEYGTWANPNSLLKAELNNSEARRGDNIGALMHHFGVLKPGETRRLIIQMGQEQTLEEALPGIDSYRNEKTVDDAFAELTDFWKEMLSTIQVETPDEALNSMLNIHNPRQCFTTLNWSRYLSLYQLGYGERGIGYRDSSQDVLGVMPYAPLQARDLIKKLLQVQKRNGSAMHQFNPLTMVGSAGDSTEREDRPHYYSDDHLWSILAATAYLKETGELSFLQVELPFYEKDKQENPIESATVLEHMKRALEFTHGNTGQHGLPLLGFADWNDTINLPVGSESAFTACLFGRALLDMVDLLRVIGDHEGADHYQTYYEEMYKTFNQSVWDWHWYISYFMDTGEPLGSHKNDAGQIYAYSQAWPIIAGFAPPDRAAQSLDSLNQLLNTRHGIKLSTPGFNGFDPQKGGVTTYPPGAKENGGIFLHVNPWVILAETIVGNGNRAYQYYSQINPAGKNERIEEFEVEPYVYPQNILGDEHPQFGLGRNSWLSGTASWMELVGIQYILGVRPEYDGLTVDPCIPSEWEKFEMTRRFRGGTYRIIVNNPDHLSKGVMNLKVNGKNIPNNRIPDLEPGHHTIEVWMGK